MPYIWKRNRKSGHHRDRPGNWKAAKYCNISVKEREQSFGPILEKGRKNTDNCKPTFSKGKCTAEALIKLLKISDNIGYLRGMSPVHRWVRYHFGGS